jgi:hypothetical protein
MADTGRRSCTSAIPAMPTRTSCAHGESSPDRRHRPIAAPVVRGSRVRDWQLACSSVLPTVIREDDLVQERVETPTMADPTYRVTFERDDGQQYGVGTRVSVHAMNSQCRTLALNPSSGSYRVTRCEQVRDTGWKALRVSLHLDSQPGSAAVRPSPAADDRR